MPTTELAAATDEMVDEAILCYLKGIDAGQSSAALAKDILARFPGAAADLTAFLADQERLDPLLSPLRAFARGELPVAPFHVPVDSAMQSSAPGARDQGTPCDAFPSDELAANPPAIPGYEILGVLGQGGMGIVYKARQVRLNRIVALKMIRTHSPADPITRVRFQSEGETVAQLDHPNIVCVYESGEVDGRPYFALEYVQGGNLAQKSRNSPWAPRAAAHLVARLADAVEYAHRQQIVHRDLKPANILLTPAGVPKIADFGLSKQLQNGEGAVTLSGHRIGTPAYMPRELAEGRLEAVGPATDIFGLGAILYDLLTGRPPYDGATREEALEQASQGRIVSPRQLRPKVPPALERICLKALAADPHERYASASALADDLQKYLSPARRVAQAAVGLVLLLGTAAAIWMLTTMDFGWGGPHVQQAADPADPAKPAGAAELAGKVRSILKTHCHRCHGQDGTLEGGLNYVLDRQLLIQRQKIVPGDPDASRLLRRVLKGQMPPKEEPARPTDAETALLAEWIKAGAPDFNAVQPPRDFVTTEDIYRSIRSDLEKSRELDRPFLRYFTITHLANAGHTEDELQSYRFGLAKLINSLSWHRTVSRPTAIDAAQTIYRIDLRDYKWSAAVWKSILAVYPYGVTYGSDAARFCVSAAKTDVPFLRADWFVYEAARPPLYHRVLELPDAAAELEKKLGVDALENRRIYRLARAGFNGSGISSSNRVIERHDSNYGAYWKSYDFAPPQGKDRNRKNIFLHPLGPGPEETSFCHDGGEILFNLPNGLQAYLLVDAADRRIDRGPTSIVKDVRQKDATVINGISCMSCHTRGVLEKDDQISQHVQKNPRAFGEAEAETILQLYKDRDKFARLWKEDTDRFEDAVKKTGAHLSKTEPIFALASRYEWELDLTQAAAETGVKVDDFLVGLQLPGLGRIFGSLKNKGHTVQRKVFEDNFGELVRDLRLGAPVLRNRPQTDPVKQPADVLTNSIGMKLKLIPRGTFQMGSRLNEADRSSEEAKHEVRISRPLFIGVHEVTQEQYQKIMGTNPSQNSGIQRGNFPVDNVSWNDAVAFCQALSKREKGQNRKYRLPTEAEWEYACRAGTDTAFHFGDDAGQLAGHAWYKLNAGQGPHQVGDKAPNAWGLHDMLGNVQEWCADLYDRNYYRASPTVDPQGPGGKEGLALRVLRGGSWQSEAKHCRSAARHSSLENFVSKTGTDYGFRVVLDVVEQDLRAIAP